MSGLHADEDHDLIYTLDGTYLSSRQTYVYAAVELTYAGAAHIEAAIGRLKAERNVRGEVKWRDDTALRDPVLRATAEAEPFIRCYVVRRIGPGEPERAHRLCLRALFWDLSNPDNPTRAFVILDEREPVLTFREAQFIAGFRSQMHLPPFTHAPSAEHLGLQCADFVVGALREREDRRGEGWNVIADFVRIRREVGP